ncbi:MAG: rRNA maturation RNase YbeY [candidate division WOR-3 bacterium]
MGRPNHKNKLRLCIFGTRDRRLKREINRLLHRLQPVINSRLLPGEINIIFVSNRKITELNRRFLGRNRPTDVLSFPLPPVSNGPASGCVRGEIYISREQARLQAKAAGIKLHTELLQLVRHGLLHLAGFSHREMNRLP